MADINPQREDRFNKVAETLRFCLIKLPKFTLIASLLIALLIAPFYFFGAVNGMIILACAAVIISKIKSWDSADINELQQMMQNHRETLNQLSIAQDQGLKTLLEKVEGLDQQLHELDLRVLDIEEPVGMD